MFILQLNDMRSSNVENLTAVARAESKEDLEQFMKAEKIESHTDGQWLKSFRQGGPLEWYNQPFSYDQTIINVGSADEWASNARMNFDQQIMALRKV